ncbi:MAG: hypothetical protein RL447_240 [Bacteroidota bacterium]
MRILSFLRVFLSLAVASCGDSGHAGHGMKSEPKTSLDSLYSSIWDAHDVVMPKMGKIRGAQKKAARMLDSLNIAWANRGMAEPAEVKSMKRSLQDLIDQLNYADYAMDRWMTEFNIDSAQQKGETRRPYLESEKVKVDRVKEAILRGLAQADSLFSVIR